MEWKKMSCSRHNRGCRGHSSYPANKQKLRWHVRQLLVVTILAVLAPLFVSSKVLDEALNLNIVDSSSLLSPPQDGRESLNAGVNVPKRERKRDRIAQEEVKEYQLLSAKAIYHQLLKLEQLYPNFATLSNSQERYGLDSAGGKNDCLFEEDSNIGCKNWFLTIEDKIAWNHNNKNEGEPDALPEVYLSGALHGNERVGPTAVTELASLLLEAASCEAKPSLDKLPGKPITLHPEEEAEWKLEVEQALACREELRRTRGINDADRKWLARLVTTRRIVVIPSANALGYYRNQREEDGIDPNRDFPFDVLDPAKCMQTVAGRTVNEIYREHLFQLSLTFHGGMEVIGFEWGAPSFMHGYSPDHVAQSEIAKGYSRFAGGFVGTPAYQTGTMNDLVYPVRGGMEDWAYAGSWAKDHVINCQPKKYREYPPEKTTYNDSTLRAFNMLVETSDSKIPQNHLGTSQDLFHDLNPQTNGHVARNIRLSLLAIDLVEPYVSILGAGALSLLDDIVPQSDRTNRSCKHTKTVRVPRNWNEIEIQWTVGGAFTVDYTSLLYAKWDDISPAIDGNSHPTEEELQTIFRFEPATSGRTQWHADGPHPPDDGTGGTDAIPLRGPVFSSTVDLRSFKPGDSIAVFAEARVDQGWTEKLSNVEPQVGPMSHIVNARTNPMWRHESAGKVVQGRLDWYSIPLTLIIGEEDIDSGLVFEELSARLSTAVLEEYIEYGTGGNVDDGNGPDLPPDIIIDRYKDEDAEPEILESKEEGYVGDDTNSNKKVKLSAHSIVIIFIVALTIIGATFKMRRFRFRYRQEIVTLEDEDDDFVNGVQPEDDENEMELRRVV